MVRHLAIFLCYAGGAVALALYGGQWLPLPGRESAVGLGLAALLGGAPLVVQLAAQHAAGQVPPVEVVERCLALLLAAGGVFADLGDDDAAEAGVELVAHVRSLRARP